MFPLTQNTDNNQSHQDIYTVHEKLRDHHQDHESYAHYTQNDLQENSQMQYQVSVQSVSGQPVSVKIRINIITI